MCRSHMGFILVVYMVYTLCISCIYTVYFYHIHVVYTSYTHSIQKLFIQQTIDFRHFLMARKGERLTIHVHIIEKRISLLQ